MSLTTNTDCFILDKETAKNPWAASTAAGVAVWSTAERINANIGRTIPAIDLEVPVHHQLFR